VGIGQGIDSLALRESSPRFWPLTLPAVPLAKPSHYAASCAGFVVWPIVWHRQEGRSYGKNERRGSARSTMVWPIAPVLSHFVTIAPFNAIGIWATTLLTYGQQRHRDMTNNGSVIWATTISAYDKQRHRDITNNGAGICAYALRGLLQMPLNSSKNENHYY
jgi:hypothetical protein